MPMFKRLCTSDSFTAKLTAVALFPPIYDRLDANQRRELRGLFVKLCKDDAPAVRRAAVNLLGGFAEILSFEHIRDELYGALSLLAKDDHDSVRLLVPKALVCNPTHSAYSHGIYQMKTIGGGSWEV
jgi:serine/threonine-protein phosphatase 2A regulatory subunit A